MNNLLKDAAKQAGWNWLEKQASPSSIDDIPQVTITAMNVWASQTIGGGEDDRPFPLFYGKSQERILSPSFLIDGWGRVWFQRQCWLNHLPTGIKSRWILGREVPQEVVDTESPT